ncbi:MAG TPA: CehA/McbA family metallohydrolase [Polyangiaceae bacterium]|nr:CehA/McbA family metallohydrolase [Polyangiaceae bacterium]
MRRLLACIAAIAATGVAACPAVHDATPQVYVARGAAERWARWVARDAAEAGGPPATAARVHVMKDGEQLGGPNAVGRPGDLLLENDAVVFVVDQLGASAGFAESGGNVVDAADARVRKDELGQLFTYFGTFPRQGVYATLASGVDADGSAWIQATGRELYEEKLAVTTRYALGPADRALFIETTVENTGDAPIQLPSLGDAVQWGDADKVAPGKPRGFKGESTGRYVGGVGRYTSYAIVPAEGPIEGTSGSGWTDTAQRKGVTVPARGSVSYARALLVGERADTSSIAGGLAAMAGEAVGELQVRLPAAALLPTGSFVTLLAVDSSESLTLAPPFAGRVPAGLYRVLPMLGRSVAPPRDPIEVRAGWTSHVDVPVEAPATLDVLCTSASDGRPMPCKLTFEGLGVTPTPDFGPAHTSGPARNQATLGDGRTSVVLVPGSYRVTASRGPEYALSSVQVDLAPGERRSETLSLARVVDTTGYAACDFHQHTMLGTDAPVGMRDRVVANAAEGVEIAVASEHNVIADLEPIVEELHLARELVEIPGDELTSDASRSPWGHANVFPLRPDPARARGGAPAVRDRAPRDVFDELRAASGEVVVQVNHPRSGKNGYFDQLGFDRALGSGTAAAYDPSFDALEVWNGRNVDARAQVLDDFRALLRASHVVTPTADTDTHGIVGQEAGYPRTYVRVSDDTRFDAWTGARTEDLVHGIKSLRDVVLTNGPMLRVSANGAPVGGVARGRIVTVKVHVECAPWVDVRTVRVVRASVPPPARDDERTVKLSPTASGALAADVAFVERADADDALFVVATGARSLAPVLGGDDREILPWAMTGAIWLDPDGDGRALGRSPSDNRR